jgi:dephospho-CoA kinase
MLFRLGLTGSIAMGKSTTAQLIREEGVPVHDSDATVAALYDKGGAGVKALFAIAPKAVVNGYVDKDILKSLIAKDPKILKRIEDAIHPLVSQDRHRFDQHAQDNFAKIVVYDIPLLFETKSEDLVDAVLVVTTDAETQRKRAFERSSMTTLFFEQILAKQLSDSEKRQRADYIVDTTNGIESAREAIRNILKKIRENENCNA